MIHVLMITAQIVALTTVVAVVGTFVRGRGIGLRPAGKQRT